MNVGQEQADILAQWRRLFDEEVAARQGLLAAATPPGSKPPPEVARQWWGAVEALLQMYSRAMAHNRHEQLEPRPVELLLALHGLAGYLAIGRIPDPIVAASGRGSPGIGPAERLHIGWATGYMRLAARGDIHDASYIKTIMDAYSVKRSTAQGWSRRAMPEDVRDALDNPKIVEARMRSSAQIYRIAGHSQTAISGRQRKRT